MENDQSCNNTAHPWETRDFHASKFGFGNYNRLDSYSYAYATTTAPVTARVENEFFTHPQGSVSHALMFPHHDGNAITTISRSSSSNSSCSNRYSLYGGDGSRLHPDPHLVCLKLGKRHYFEDSTSLGASIGKRGKPYYNLRGGAMGQSSPTTAVPRCQVEGCHVTLVNAKDYHRRHKVCEKHSKAPTVMVLGLEQRFCQQCSRFHVVSEFDDSKRSCRRRLAGHNERRRKGSHDSVSRTDNRMARRHPYLSSSTGCALSLLSSVNDSWFSPSDLSSRSSAALRELIAENRASILARQLIRDQDWQLHHHSMEDLGEAQAGSNSMTGLQHRPFPESHGWDPFPGTGSHVTLDLMQASTSAFSMLSVRGKAKEEEEECSELWNSLEGAHV
ncbi:hypothetical protein SLEP1_g2727 [Rubroshorea leprosula]|uniref:SBP-type domain-containing protein n=1 Tax=Rubroshorea leprosula TaxID=152421 RepID=A0AAV5HI36_9ROSI|nr:hypothetical protein SLEP1_g2727 [Rubroshorea leprosula]